MTFLKPLRSGFLESNVILIIKDIHLQLSGSLFKQSLCKNITFLKLQGHTLSVYI